MVVIVLSDDLNCLVDYYCYCCCCSVVASAWWWWGEEIVCWMIVSSVKDKLSSSLVFFLSCLRGKSGLQ